MSLLSDLAVYLEGQGQVLGASGYALALNYFPETPNKVVGVFDTGGGEADGDGVSADDYDTVTFQVRVRGEPWTHEATRAKMESLFRLLDDSSPTSGWIFAFPTQSTPLPLGLDNNNRPQYACNFTAMRKRTTT